MSRFIININQNKSAEKAQSVHSWHITACPAQWGHWLDGVQVSKLGAQNSLYSDSPLWKDATKIAYINGQIDDGVNRSIWPAGQGNTKELSGWPPLVYHVPLHQSAAKEISYSW